MSKFKQGERVCVANTTDACNFHRAMSDYVPAPGTKGVVDRTDDMGAWVAWEGRHGCSKPKTWVTNDLLVLATPEHTKEKIVIYRRGQSVFARNLLTGKIAEAKCSPEDEFDFHIGAKLAFDRLMGLEEKPKEKQPEYLNTKVVCVALGHGITGSCDVNWWTLGRIYSVVNGVIRDNEGDPREKITSLEELNRQTDRYATFIELVE